MQIVGKDNCAFSLEQAIEQKHQTSKFEGNKIYVEDIMLSRQVLICKTII